MGLPKMLSSGSALLVAPMAGGPSTPALVVNAWRAGHFAQLAAGYKTVAAMSDEIAQVRAAQVSVFGVNLFVPSRVSISDGAYRAYADRLRGIALDLGQELPPLREDEDLWAEKIDALIADPVPVVSFTFGLPGEDVFRRVRDNKWGEVDLDEVDRSTNVFSITNVKASKCRRVARWLEEEAARQFLAVTTEVCDAP